VLVQGKSARRVRIVTLKRAARQAVMRLDQLVASRQRWMVDPPAEWLNIIRRNSSAPTLTTADPMPNHERMKF
jgi:hypothetical protein